MAVRTDKIIKQLIYEGTDVPLNQVGRMLDKTVVFITDNNMYVTISVKNGVTIVAPPTPSKSGHAFLGWGKSTTATSYVQFPYTPTAEKETLYAVWHRVTNATVSNMGSYNPTLVTFAKDTDFPSSFDDWTDSHGNMFIKIPTMYRKVNTVYNNQITSYTISTEPIDSSSHPYPCFVAPDGSILPYVYIGKYCNRSTETINSVPDGTIVSLTPDSARTRARAIGSGYQLFDWQFQKLFVDLSYVTSATGNFNQSDGPLASYLGMYDLDYEVYIDGIGRYYVSMSNEIVGYLIAYNPANYINDPSSSSTGYSTVNYTMTGNQGRIVKLGYDSSNEFFNYPASVSYPGTENTYYDDYMYNIDEPVLNTFGYHGGLWDIGVPMSWTDPFRMRLCYRNV